MYNYYPILIIGAVIGVAASIMILAFVFMKDKKEAFGFDRKMKDGYLVKRLLVYAKPYWRQFAVSILIMLGSIGYSVASPLIVASVERLIQQKEGFELSSLFLHVVGYASLLVVSLVCTYIQAILLQKTGQKIIARLREDLFTHIEHLSHEQLNNIPVGKLVTRVTNDVNAISMMFTNILVNLIQNFLVIFGMLGAMLFVNYTLTLMVLCFTPLIVLFTVIFRKFSRKSYRRVKDGTTDINTFLSENLSGIKIIQIFNREERKLEEFTDKNDRLQKARFEQIYVFSIFRPLVYMLYISSVLFLFYIAGKGYVDNTAFLGQTIRGDTVVAFYMYINRFFNPIQNLADQFNRMQSAFASAEKIFSILEIEPAVVDLEGAEDITEIKGEIEFRHVWFSYIPDEWVLKDVSFHIPAGETAAFVGATGSGKTTILSLLCRNYDIQQGEILLDGIDIRRFQLSSLRSHFGQMLQDVFLFSGTIRSNITLRDAYTDEEIMEACRYVNADKLLLKLKDGLDEEVRERGNNFSAGERQLISFARTVIHAPKVMILDEATANIDTETEQLIQDSLEKMRSIGTMLVVAHRLSTIQHADKIIVLDHGEIQESGTHEELLKQRGRYYELYRLQYEKQKLTQAD